MFSNAYEMFPQLFELSTWSSSSFKRVSTCLTVQISFLTFSLKCILFRMSDIVTLPSPVDGSSSLSFPADVDSDHDVSMFQSDSESIEVPPDVDETIAMSGFDDALDPLGSGDEAAHLQLEFQESKQGFRDSGLIVPTSLEVPFLTGKQDVAEVYSPPRVLPVARADGLLGNLSLDILTGWDSNQEHLRNLAKDAFVALQISVLILSPPCAIFSELQRLWNIKKMSKETFNKKWSDGMVHLNFAMELATLQLKRGAYFIFEHPWKASSWETPTVKAVLTQPGVMVVNFDQCCLGLKSKVFGIPMRKRTKIMTNSQMVVTLFAQNQCDRSHIHQTIQGSEGGVRRSVWAQRYPPGMVSLLVQAAKYESR